MTRHESDAWDAYNKRRREYENNLMENKPSWLQELFDSFNNEQDYEKKKAKERKMNFHIEQYLNENVPAS